MDGRHVVVVSAGQRHSKALTVSTKKGKLIVGVQVIGEGAQRQVTPKRDCPHCQALFGKHGKPHIHVRQVHVTFWPLGHPHKKHLLHLHPDHDAPLSGGRFFGMLQVGTWHVEAKLKHTGPFLASQHVTAMVTVHPNKHVLVHHVKGHPEVKGKISHATNELTILAQVAGQLHVDASEIYADTIVHPGPPLLVKITPGDPSHLPSLRPVEERELLAQDKGHPRFDALIPSLYEVRVDYGPIVLTAHADVIPGRTTSCVLHYRPQTVSSGGTWTQLAQDLNRPLPINPSSMILLTDGAVLVQDAGGVAGGSQWIRLTPDAQGNYTLKAWSGGGTMTNSRLYFASGVLMDGRVFAIGGEYSDAGGDTPLGEIFNPLSNTWSQLAKPPGYALPGFDWIRGDAACCVLADGRVLLGCIGGASPAGVLLDGKLTAIWDPVHGTWTEAGIAFGTKAVTKKGSSNEETWTLLPDGSVVTVETFNPNAAERYLPAKDVWIGAGNTPQSLIDTASTLAPDEIGPAILLPNGQVFAIGGSGHTALYTPPSSPSSPGYWDAGPELKDVSNNALSAKDAPAVLLPNGKVLFCAGPLDATSGYSGPMLFFEYDPIFHSLSQTPTQPFSIDTFPVRLMLLPSGQVLATAGQNQVWIYTPDGGPDPAWRPRIKTYPDHVSRGSDYVLMGQELNGLSQAVSYGDDYSAATNYPLVRLTQGSTVRYCRTYGFSTLGVATANSNVSTHFHVPDDAPLGLVDLVVVANGIPSDPVPVHVEP